MTLWQNYHIAQSIDDALEALAKAPGDSQIIAGGTDLLLDIQQGRHPPVHTLVDVTEIPEMTRLEEREGGLFIGASVPHKVIASSPLITTHCAALAEASSLIGGPQVRNSATIGGNVAHALPAADGTIALMALDASAEIANASGRRRVPLGDLFAGPGKSTLSPQLEILTGFYVGQRQSAEASVFKRVMRPQGVAIAILNMAVWLRRKGDIFEDIRIAVGPSGPVPRRMHDTETILRGKSVSEGTFNLAYEALLNEASFRTSRHRATEEYRQKISRVLLEETLKEAFQRSKIDM
jgi:carbon-monoxide dehydrogenase medium subunit